MKSSVRVQAYQSHISVNKPTSSAQIPLIHQVMTARAAHKINHPQIILNMYSQLSLHLKLETVRTARSAQIPNCELSLHPKLETVMIAHSVRIPNGELSLHLKLETVRTAHSAQIPNGQFLSSLKIGDSEDSTLGLQDQSSSDNPKRRTLSSPKIGDSDDSTLGPNPKRRTLSSPKIGDSDDSTLAASLKIGTNVMSTIILIIFIRALLFLVLMVRTLGWQRTKTKLGNWFCCCLGSENSNGGKTVHVDNNTWREEEAKIESLKSGISINNLFNKPG